MTDTQQAPAPEEPKPDTLEQRIEKRVEGQVNLQQMLMRTDAAGNNMLVIPAELSQKFNVLAPSAVLSQQVTMFQPGFTAVQLDVLTDFYTMDKVAPNKGSYPRALSDADVDFLNRVAVAHGLVKDGKISKWPLTISMSKIGLRKLVDAGAVRFGGQGEGGHDGTYQDVELHASDGKVRTIKAAPFFYKAVGSVRRSDGTMKSYAAESEWDPFISALEAEAAAAKMKYGDAMTNVVEVFSKSLKFRRPMAKSKAQNAIVRDALAIKAKYDPFEATKPFFVVSYDFAPDGSEAATQIMAAMYGVESGNSTEAVYGAPALPEAEVLVVDDAPLDANVPDEVLEPEIIDGTATIVEPVVYPEPVGPAPAGVDANGVVVDDTPFTMDTSAYDEVPSREAGPLTAEEKAEYMALLDLKLQHIKTNAAKEGLTIGETVDKHGASWFKQAIENIEPIKGKLGGAQIEEYGAIRRFSELADKVGLL